MNNAQHIKNLENAFDACINYDVPPHEIIHCMIELLVDPPNWFKKHIKYSDLELLRSVVNGE